MRLNFQTQLATSSTRSEPEFCPVFGVIGVILFNLIACGPPSPVKISNVQPTPTVSRPKSSEMNIAYFLNRMADLSAPAKPRPKERMVLRSSYDPKTESREMDILPSKYIIDGVTWHVLLDEEGPGCIARMWFAGRVAGRMQILFDNEPQPRIDTNIPEFFSGRFPHVNSPLVFSPTQSGNGYVSYFPLPFARHCTILTDSVTPKFKYQINVLLMDPSHKVVSFNPGFDAETEAALKRVGDLYGKAALERFQSIPKTRLANETINPKQKKLVVNASGPAAIDYFQIQLTPVDRDTVAGVRIQMYWDDYLDPTVNCTLREFFCGYLEVKTWYALPMGFWGDQNIFFSQFYMPFRYRGQIYLENTSDKPVTVSVEYHVDWLKTNEDFLYFYALSHQHQFLMSMTYPFLEFEGNGNFVGFSMLSANPQSAEPFFSLEGNEYFYINGEPEPSWSGTGTDNFFNGDDRLNQYSPFWLPTHGCPARSTGEHEIVHCYRFLYPDAIPFSTSLMMIKEIGNPLRYSQIDTPHVIPTFHEWTCYLYGKPAQNRVQRRENVAYYAIDQNEQGRPTYESPLMKNYQLRIKLPSDNWWLHYAPVWDITQVKTQKVQ